MDMVLGVDTISALGGADMRYERGRFHQVVFGVSCAVTETKHPLSYGTVSREEDNVGLGIGEYPSYPWRRKVFYREVENWIARGWMVKHDPARHEPYRSTSRLLPSGHAWTIVP